MFNNFTLAIVQFLVCFNLMPFFTASLKTFYNDKYDCKTTEYDRSENIKQKILKPTEIMNRRLHIQIVRMPTIFY